MQIISKMSEIVEHTIEELIRTSIGFSNYQQITDVPWFSLAFYTYGFTVLHCPNRKPVEPTPLFYFTVTPIFSNA